MVNPETGAGGGDGNVAPRSTPDWTAIRRQLKCCRELKRAREERDDFIEWKQTQTEVCTDDRALWVLLESDEEEVC